jgi:hypothetical protein
MTAAPTRLTALSLIASCLDPCGHERTNGARDVLAISVSDANHEENSNKIEIASPDAALSTNDRWCVDVNQRENWCNGAFRISSAEAYYGSHATSHFSELVRTHRGGIGLASILCARMCATPTPECGYGFKLVADDTTGVSHLVEWVYVDSMTGRLWFQTTVDGGLQWRFEDSPPWRGAKPDASSCE